MISLRALIGQSSFPTLPPPGGWGFIYLLFFLIKNTLAAATMAGATVTRPLIGQTSFPTLLREVVKKKPLNL